LTLRPLKFLPRKNHPGSGRVLAQPERGLSPIRSARPFQGATEQVPVVMPAIRAASWDNSRSVFAAPPESARGLAQSKTLRAFRESLANAPASWTAVALYRFSPLWRGDETIHLPSQVAERASQPGG